MLRCLISTVGGDAPGTNAAVRAVTRLALERELEVYGAKQGWIGLMRGQFWKLRRADVGMIMAKGGSVLGSSDYKIPQNDDESLDRLVRALRKFDLVVMTGGLGSFAVLDRLYDRFDMGLTTTMFIPASVEGEFLDPRGAGMNEDGTRRVHAESIGADTAANTAVQSIDRLRDQAFHSKTVFLVECIGTKSNWLPIQIGLSSGAHRVYLPRYPVLADESKAEIRELYGSDFDPNRVDIKELVAWIETQFEEETRKYLLVVLPNGVPLVNVGPLEAPTESYEHSITSQSNLDLTVLRVAESVAIHFEGPEAPQMRYVLLDDLQRGGTPTVRDRMLGSLYGEAAVEEYLSIVNGVDANCRGNLNLLAIDETSHVGWRCHPRQQVASLYRGETPRAGGVDPLPFFRQARGTVSGYRPLATL